MLRSHILTAAQQLELLHCRITHPLAARIPTLSTHRKRAHTSAGSRRSFKATARRNGSADGSSDLESAEQSRPGADRIPWSHVQSDGAASRQVPEASQLDHVAPMAEQGRHDKPEDLHREPDSRDWSAIMECLHTSSQTALELLLQWLSRHIPGRGFRVVKVMHSAFHDLSGNQECSMLLWDTYIKVDSSYPLPLSLTQQTLLAVLRTRSGGEVADCVIRMRERGYRLTHHTILHAADMLMRSNQPESSMDMIEMAIAAGASTSDGPLPRIVAKIVRWAGSPSGDYSTTTELLSRALGMGITPALSTYNALILNAADAKDGVTAWHLFDTIRLNGLEPDDYTYTILLKMCRNLDHKVGFKMYNFFSRGIKDGDRSLPLVAEMILCRHIFGDREIFGDCLRIYERHCSLQPLKDLELLPQGYRSDYQDSLAPPKPLPNPQILRIILYTFLRYLPINERTSAWRIRDLFACFRSLVDRGNPLMIRLASTDHIHNTFLKALSREIAFFEPRNAAITRRDRIRLPETGSLHGHELSIYWGDMFKMMQKPFPIEVVDEQSGRVLKPPMPSLYSWNIVLNAAAHLGHEAEAEAVLRDMEQRGFVPNVVSYTSMLSGFVAFQQHDVLAGILDRMRTAGVTANDRTVRELQAIKHKRHVLRTTHEIAAGTRLRYRFTAVDRPALPSVKGLWKASTNEVAQDKSRLVRKVAHAPIGEAAQPAPEKSGASNGASECDAPAGSGTSLRSGQAAVRGPQGLGAIEIARKRPERRGSVVRRVIDHHSAISHRHIRKPIARTTWRTGSPELLEEALDQDAVEPGINARGSARSW